MVILKTLIGNLSANVNEITFTDNIIDSNSIIEVYYNSNDIYTVETWQREHTIGIVTSDHDFPVSVKVLINNVVAFSPYDDSELLSRLSSDEDDITALDGRLDTAEDNITSLGGRLDIVESALPTKQDVLTAGNNITIEDNVISASDSSVVYSTNERAIGTWIDGSTIYRKTIHMSNITVINGTTIAHGISNLLMCTKLDAICYDESGTSFPLMSMGSQYADNASERSLGFRVNPTNFIAYGKNEFVAQTTRHWYFTIEYIKVTD